MLTYQCIMEASVGDRLAFVQEKKLCAVCINSHLDKPCKYKFKCKLCKGHHNTLLHTEDSVEANQSVAASIVLTCVNKTSYKKVLPTIKVKIVDKFGRDVYCRALLDTGSSESFATTSLVERLGFATVAECENIIGVAKQTTIMDRSVIIPVESCQYQDVKFNVDCHVVKDVTAHLPPQYVDCSKLKFPSHVKLSDENFNEPSEISMLLASDIYFESLLNDCIKLPEGLVLQSTLFGYVVGGKISQSGNVSNTALVTNFAISDTTKLENVMSQFWLAEKVPEPQQKVSDEFEKAEKIFQKSVTLNDNKFQVDIPLKHPLGELNLGNSFSAALQRFYSIERKFMKNVDLLERYKKFIDEYVEMGHAREVDINSYDILNGPVSFLAHHPVFNEASKSTKLRVVMDGSMKSKNKLSVNDVMLNGPVVQGELFDILILFRTYLFTLICDVQKMFRCILVSPEHRCLQNILWRDSPGQPIRCLQLQTVTYGLKSSTFLATRCLVELVKLFGCNYPLASQAILSNTYVNDVITGSDNINELHQLKNELIDLFKLGYFNLHKWCSSYPAVLDDLPENLKYLEQIHLDSSNVIKTLGLRYDITSDTLTFECPPYDEDSNHTKRTVLSFIGKCYDPLGLIAPIIVPAKIFMQVLWSMPLGWDTALPDAEHETWKKFLANLKMMGKVSLPRLVYSHECQLVELVGYADASFKAFGCCIYVRVFKADGGVDSKLLCAKSKVAPLAKSLTIPQLELNSALLLAQLASRVSEKLKARFAHNTYFYSDSQIVLCWLKSTKTKVNTYVNNRVKKILELTNQDQWSYVRSCENPADLISRGVEPQILQGKQLWWDGPKYLSHRDYVHPAFDTLSQALHDKHLDININEDLSCNFSQRDDSFAHLFEKYSSLHRLQNVIAYIYRFYKNASKAGDRSDSTLLTPKELQEALLVIIKNVQRKHFSKEIDTLLAGKSLKSGIADLHPFVDQCGVLRVGGRLQNADISQARKHPPILPKGSFFTSLLIKTEHLRLLHLGARAVLSSLAQKYWIINGIREVKKVVNKCVTCLRLKAEAAKQLMGSLPVERITASRAFQYVGIDFCGPFSTKIARIRKPLVTKSYIALFVCFATKAIHVELVSNLTTETFLACLNRFISRRGMPTLIYCDNAKTFEGAANQLKGLYDLQCSNEHRESVYRYCNKKYISFKFIPSYAPLFANSRVLSIGPKIVRHYPNIPYPDCHCHTFFNKTAQV
ncbi:uncharacterized protein LOC133533941 [Cydia pomonella]|uniref:uncharacterized protein LOC133533941 n=1 Tax=Cydia pomonella TaxID=82600 RepID=UPI002ADD720E|nr:uncharacterized protein LOC133533941 [Cydia pomonella]